MGPRGGWRNLATVQTRRLTLPQPRAPAPVACGDRMKYDTEGRPFEIEPDHPRHVLRSNRTTPGMCPEWSSDHTYDIRTGITWSCHESHSRVPVPRIFRRGQQHQYARDTHTHAHARVHLAVGGADDCRTRHAHAALQWTLIRCSWLAHRMQLARSPQLDPVLPVELPGREPGVDHRADPDQ
jgi:hypothetical protein